MKPLDGVWSDDGLYLKEFVPETAVLRDIIDAQKAKIDLLEKALSDRSCCCAGCKNHNDKVWENYDNRAQTESWDIG